MSNAPTPGKTCGNCKFRVPMQNDLKISECYGMPPVPMAIPTPAGIQIGATTPRVDVTRPACSLYQSKMSFAS